MTSANKTAEYKKRILKIMNECPDDKRHGTDTGYMYGCRCSRCKKAHAITRKEERRARTNATEKREVILCENCKHFSHHVTQELGTVFICSQDKERKRITISSGYCHLAEAVV